jgi:cytochrome c1
VRRVESEALEVKARAAFRQGARKVKWLVFAMTAGLGACAGQEAAPRQIAGADPDRAPAIMEREGCAACHEIPGVQWPRGTVGGSLADFSARPLIAGRLPNQPDVLVVWLRDAPSLSPTTGMPPVSISEAEARDVAAYLYTLDER